jgi:hypothetical protein
VVWKSLLSTVRFRSNVVLVYPGYSSAESDRASNGSFNTGDVVPALCRAIGRTVTSDPTYGEIKRSSDIWIRILGSPGETQYATLTYGEVSPIAAQLPPC